MIILDDFLEDADAAVQDAIAAGFRDVSYKDGAVYPDVSPGADEDLRRYVVAGIQGLVGFDIDVQEFFYRRSKKNVEAPHWAHTDGDISQFVALIYLTDPPADVEAGLKKIRTSLKDIPEKERISLIKEAQKLINETEDNSNGKAEEKNRVETEQEASVSDTGSANSGS